MSAFGDYVRSMVQSGQTEAYEAGSPTIEAEHLLLAMSRVPGTGPHDVLTAAGLDRAAILAALARETEHSLGAVGVSEAAFGLPRATPDPGRKPKIGATTKLALERAFTLDRRQRLRPAHLLIGVLRAEAGTVPRALALAGVDREALTEAARQAAEAEQR